MRTHATVEQFVTGGPAMKVVYLVAYDDGLDVKSEPVVGWLHQRHRFTNGAPPEDNILPAILNTEFFTVEPAVEVHTDSANTEMVGVYPVDDEPEPAEIEFARDALRAKFQIAWERSQSFPSKRHRELSQQQLTRWAAVLQGQAAA